MTVNPDTSAHDQVVFYPGPAIVVTDVHIVTSEARYRVRDLTFEVSIHQRPHLRRCELAAWHEGRRIVLFATESRRVFGQVRRAVVRAVEANRPPRP